MAALSPSAKRDLLAGVPLFAALDARELEALVSVTRSRSLAGRREFLEDTLFLNLPIRLARKLETPAECVFD